jgi:hypothetical protein
MQLGNRKIKNTYKYTTDTTHKHKYIYVSKLYKYIYKCGLMQLNERMERQDEVEII